nr:MAK10-like protein [Tanacetum cinerariifolium]
MANTSTQPTQVNKVTTSCEICSGPHDTQYCMKDPEQGFVEYASLRTNEVGGKRNSMAPKSIASISHVEGEELRKKGIKIPSKLLSSKYLSLTSIKELNKNSLALKRVHFVNSIVILIKDIDTEEEDISSTNAHEHNLESMVRRKEEAKEQGKEENEMGTAKKVEELFKDKEIKTKAEE